VTTVRIATRGSALALTQSRWVAARIAELCPDVAVELVIIKTEGDLRQDRPLSAIGGRGVFVKAIEDALLEGQADAAVHSLKDMPSELPPGLVLAAHPEREDPRDVLVLPAGSSGESIHRRDAEKGRRDGGGALWPRSGQRRGPVPGQRNASGESFSASSVIPLCASSEAGGENPNSVELTLPLAHGAKVGTSGPRRRAVLLHGRPDLCLADVRGNLDTRLRKLDAGEYDALILAAAGLRRMGWAERISFPLPVEWSVPAVGQGALAVETRAGETSLIERLSRLDHAPTRACVTAERAALARLRGGCTVPFGAHATVAEDTLTIHGMIADPDGTRLIRQSLSGPASDPAALGTRLAESLLAAGGAALIGDTRP
jgi:hydroxymethylbilane synthase